MRSNRNGNPNNRNSKSHNSNNIRINRSSNSRDNHNTSNNNDNNNRLSRSSSCKSSNRGNPTSCESRLGSRSLDPLVQASQPCESDGPDGANAAGVSETGAQTRLRLVTREDMQRLWRWI
jgi:hypothetical protein